MSYLYQCKQNYGVRIWPGKTNRSLCYLTWCHIFYSLFHKLKKLIKHFRIFKEKIATIAVCKRSETKISTGSFKNLLLHVRVAWTIPYVGAHCWSRHTPDVSHRLQFTSVHPLKKNKIKMKKISKHAVHSNDKSNL